MSSARITGYGHGHAQAFSPMRRALTRRTLGRLAGAALLARPDAARAGLVLRVADQKGGAKSLMQAAGVLDGLPYALEWSLFAGAPMLLAALNAGAVDLGQIGDAPLSFAIAGGNRMRVIAAHRSDPGITALVVGRTSSIQTVADLRGRSVATLHGQTGHYLTLAALQRAGLGFDAVRFVFMPPAAAHVALVAGSVDSWASWGPYTAQAELVDGAREIVNGRGLMSGLSYVVASPQAVAGKRTALADFLARLARAQAWSRSHEGAYVSAWAAEIGLPVDVAAAVVARSIAQPAPLDDAVVAAQQRVADFMAESGMLPAPQRVAGAFELGFG